MKIPRIILASTSPRRADMLRQAGLAFQVTAPEVDESEVRGESPRAMVIRLAKAKAAAVVAKTSLKPGPILVIAADTIVVAPGKKRILGKPSGSEDALRMLQILAGRRHTVFTGYCLTLCEKGKKEKSQVRVVESQVKMRALDQNQMDSYILTGEPLDKAGAYAAQGIGMALIESIEGSYSNVVGLPLCQVIQDLEKKFGFRWNPRI